MTVATASLTASIAEFIVNAAPPPRARERAAVAVCDTVSVVLAGAAETAPRTVRATITSESRGNCRILGTAERASASEAAFANGVAAHALDYDDMCFVSMAHPSCALVPAAIAAAELADASGRACSTRYIVGFEVECRLGMTMNPRHYHGAAGTARRRIGTLGAAAAAARVLKLPPAAAVHALGIAASLACGLKENFGTMVKPLHAGAGRAQRRHGGAARAAGVHGERVGARRPAGLPGRDGQRASGGRSRGGHPGSRHALGDPRHRHHREAVSVVRRPRIRRSTRCSIRARAIGSPRDDVDAIDVEVDSMTPRLLIYDRPSTGLEAKFSMPFCAAAAIVFGHLDIDTFDVRSHRRRRASQRCMPRVTLRVEPGVRRRRRRCRRRASRSACATDAR